MIGALLKFKVTFLLLVCVLFLVLCVFVGCSDATTVETKVENGSSVCQNHLPIFVEEEFSTCVSRGHCACYYCESCDKYFIDSEGNIECPDEDFFYEIDTTYHDYEVVEYKPIDENDLTKAWQAILRCKREGCPSSNKAYAKIFESYPAEFSSKDEPTCVSDGFANYILAFKRDDAEIMGLENGIYVAKVKTKDKDLNNHSFDLDNVKYEFNEEEMVCTAKIECTLCHDIKEILSNKVERANEVEATCTAKGRYDLVATFDENIRFNSRTFTITKMIEKNDNAHNFDYKNATYTFTQNDDGKWTCTATAKCTFDSTHTHSLSVDATFETVLDQETRETKNVLKATFDSPFTSQEKEEDEENNF